MSFLVDDTILNGSNIDTTNEIQINEVRSINNINYENWADEEKKGNVDEMLCLMHKEGAGHLKELLFGLKFIGVFFSTSSTLDDVFVTQRGDGISILAYRFSIVDACNNYQYLQIAVS